MEVITKQKCHEHVYLLRYKYEERDAWYYLLTPYDKLPLIKKYEKGERVDLNGCYRPIEYRDEHGEIRRASGYGKDPPNQMIDWIKHHYGKKSKLYAVKYI